MSTKSKGTKYIRPQVPDAERCVFSSSHGNRCTNPHLGNVTGYCILHEGRIQKEDEGEARSVAEQLLANNAELMTRDEVNRFASGLLKMVTEKRISRQDGTLLAYIASVLLQTIAPVTADPVAPKEVEYVESVAEPIRDERIMPDRNVAKQIVPEPPMPGRSYNPYTYPSKWK
jgi:hypothetical protein